MLIAIETGDVAQIFASSTGSASRFVVGVWGGIFSSLLAV